MELEDNWLLAIFFLQKNLELIDKETPLIWVKYFNILVISGGKNWEVKCGRDVLNQKKPEILKYFEDAALKNVEFICITQSEAEVNGWVYNRELGEITSLTIQPSIRQDHSSAY